MKTEKFNIEEEQKKLVLARFRTLNPKAKIMLGKGEEVTVEKLMEHVEKGDDFGEKVVKAQITMLQVLSGVQ
jgi:hypothetical protein